MNAIQENANVMLLAVTTLGLVCTLVMLWVVFGDDE